nr:MBL fold metallo-hydrolase [Ardenticatena sp.]
MDIKWYGHACFRIRRKNAVVVTDPFPRSLGYNRPRTRADIVTISHDHPHHSARTGFQGAPFFITGPGEYEVAGIFVTGIRTYHDTQKGAERGSNTVYMIRFDELNVCHLGDLGHVPSQSQVEDLSEVDVLLIPVGGGGALTPAMAAETISLIEPRIVIPMHYKTDVYDGGLLPVEQFLKVMGVKVKDVSVEDELKIRSRTQLPDETQIVLLSYK